MLGWFQALMPKEERFFDLFERHAQTMVEGSHALRALLEGGDAIAVNAPHGRHYRRGGAKDAGGDPFAAANAPKRCKTFNLRGRNLTYSG